jgi:hypothetical protein
LFYTVDIVPFVATFVVPFVVPFVVLFVVLCTIPFPFVRISYI